MEEFPVVIDNGSGSMRAGIAGDLIPSVIFPMVLGMDINEKEMLYFGYEGEGGRESKYEVYSPVQNGIITHWDNMEAIWEYTLEEQLNYINNAPILISEVPWNLDENRQRMAEIFFERFDVSGLFPVDQASLSFWNQGKSKGIVVTSGYGCTYSVPIIGGIPVLYALNRSHVTGKTLNEYFERKLIDKGYSFPKYRDKKVLSQIKESACYYKGHGKFIHRTEYKLANGTKYIPDELLHEVPEALFNPKLVGMGDSGIHELIQESIRSTPADFRKEMCQNIIISGGNTNIIGFSRKVDHMLSNGSYVPFRYSNVGSSETNSTWLGGSLMAFNSSNFITKEEYLEHGSGYFSRKMQI